MFNGRAGCNNDAVPHVFISMVPRAATTQENCVKYFAFLITVFYSLLRVHSQQHLNHWFLPLIKVNPHFSVFKSA